ncbi:MAG: hypothetical protein ABSF23_13425 [Terracidiphilus sp.]
MGNAAGSGYPPAGNAPGSGYAPAANAADTGQAPAANAADTSQAQAANAADTDQAPAANAAASSNATVRIGGASLRANGEVAQGFQYTGPCPVELQFGWGVIATEPTTIDYWFVRSDGGQSSHSKAVDLPQANRSVPVYDVWRLGANSPRFANYTGWVKLVIDVPNQVEDKIGFTIHCQ